MRLVPETAIDPRLMPWATIVKPLLAAFLTCVADTEQSTAPTLAAIPNETHHNPATANAVAANPYDIQAVIANFKNRRKILIEYK